LSLGLLIVLFAGVPAGAQTAPAAVQLSDVSVTTQPDAVTVHVKTSGAPKYQAELIDTPHRLVVDLEDTTYAWRKTPLVVGAEPLRQIRGSQYKQRVARVVVELTRKVGYAIREDDRGLAIIIPTKALPAVSDGAKPRETRPAAARGTAPAPVEPPRAPLRVAQAPTPRPVVPPPPPPAVVAQATPAPAPAPGQTLISLDFKDADVVNLLRILAAESTKNIVIGEDVKGKMSISLRNVPWDLALETVLDAKGLVKTEKDNVVRIVTADLLAKERDARAKAEEAKVKAETELRTKLAEAQLKEQEAAAKKLAAEQAAQELAARGPLVEETIRLSYGDPEDVAKTLQGILGIAGDAAAAPAPAAPFSGVFGPTPPAPPGGPAGAPDTLAKGITIRAHKPTNSIFIRHYKNDLDRIKKLVSEKLDVPLPQVKIEARLNELSRTNLFEVGVQLGGAGVRRDGQNVVVGQGYAPYSRSGGVDAVRASELEQQGGTAAVVTNPARGTVLGTATAPVGVASPLINPGLSATPGLLDRFLPVSTVTGLPLGGNLVNALPTNLPLGGISFGIIGTRFNLNLALQALERENKTKSLARPEIVTVENTTASIALGSDIPYATVSSAGTQVQFKEATLKLEVTPTVIYEPNNVTRIKMKLVVEDNSRGENVPAGTGVIPSINKRRAATEVIVKEGETLVIGGITQRQDLETIRKVPLFGDIPVIGWLFKTRLTQTDPNRELVVFVTPSIIRRETASAAPTPGQPRAR
jgi:type IV pilus assembly protein PilQ